MWGNWGLGMPGYFGYGGMFMGLLMLVGLAVAVFFGIRLVGRIDRKNLSESALEVLKKRYARGEISHEEYIKMREDLKD